MNGFDDELRDALAGGAPPTPDFADVRRRARAAQRRGRALAGTALAVMLLAAGGLAWAVTSDEDGGDRTNVITDSPDETTTTATTRPPDSTATTAAAIEPGPRPTTALIVTNGGDLRTIDVAGGATVAELGRYEPGHDEETGMSWFLDDVAMSADGATAYISRCCEPASGAMSVLPTDGSVFWEEDGLGEHTFGNVWLVRPAPDGSGQLAVAQYDGVNVTSAAAPDLARADIPWPATSIGAEGLAWLPDGRLVYTGHETADGGRGELHIVRSVRPNEVEAREPIEPPDGAVWRQPTVRRDGMVVVVESHPDGDRAVVLDPNTGESVTDFPLDGEVVSLGYDPTGTWLLVVYDDGRLVGMGGGEVFTIATDVARADW